MQKNVKYFCDTSQFPSLQIYGPHMKPHGVQGLGQHYHILFGPKLGRVTCTIRWIPCSCIKCKSVLDKYCTPNILPQQQPRYQPVI